MAKIRLAAPLRKIDADEHHLGEGEAEYSAVGPQGSEDLPSERDSHKPQALSFSEAGGGVDFASRNACAYAGVIPVVCKLSWYAPS
jgi:hypothetical protein